MATPVLLTVRSIEGNNVTSHSESFDYERMRGVRANQNLNNSISIAEAGDSNNKLSDWTLSGDGVTNGVLYWQATNPSGTIWKVEIFSDSYFNHKVATGQRSTATGTIYMNEFNNSKIFGSVVVTSIAAADTDAANTLTVTGFVLSKDMQLSGVTEFAYEDFQGTLVAYTVDETVSAIHIMGGGNTSFLEANVSLSNAQLTILNGTSVEVISAPGVGFVIEIISALFILDYSGAAITGNDNIQLVNETGTVLAAAFEGLSGSADEIAQLAVLPDAEGTQLLMKANEAVEVTVGTGNPTMGASTSTANIVVTYKITTL